MALWSLSDDRPIGSAEGGYTDGLAFSPNGAFLLRTDAGSTLRCYEPLTGGTRFVFKAEERVFFDVAVSPDGTRFAAACSNGTVLIGSLLYAKGKQLPTSPAPPTYRNGGPTSRIETRRRLIRPTVSCLRRPSKVYPFCAPDYALRRWFRRSS